MSLVHMRHPKSNDELKVPAKKVKAYESAGWKVKPTKAAPATQAGKSDEKVSN